jgi:hypothetical protein
MQVKLQCHGLKNFDRVIFLELRKNMKLSVSVGKFEIAYGDILLENTGQIRIWSSTGLMIFG